MQTRSSFLQIFAQFFQHGLSKNSIGRVSKTLSIMCRPLAVIKTLKDHNQVPFRLNALFVAQTAFQRCIA